MTFNRKYAICVKLSRIEFHLAVMKQNTLITNFHQRQSQKNKKIIHDHRLKTFELCGDLIQKLGGLHMDSPYIKCKNKIHVNPTTTEEKYMKKNLQKHPINRKM